jgi:hypothetical protein
MLALLYLIPNLRMAIRAPAREPIERLPALWTAPCCRLFFNPSLYPLLFHGMQLLDHMLMVGDTIHHMGVREVLQPLTGKLGALKTPGHLFFLGTLTKPVPTVHTVRRYPIGETSVAAKLFNGKPLFP